MFIDINLPQNIDENIWDSELFGFCVPLVSSASMFLECMWRWEENYQQNVILMLPRSKSPEYPSGWFYFRNTHNIELCDLDYEFDSVAPIYQQKRRATPNTK